MSRTTGIEWTDKTWNPTTGCNKVSHGCTHCYAEILTQRFPKAFPNGFEFTIHPDRLSQPQRWRKPARIFVNSMSDLFHEEMLLDFLKQVFQVMNDTPRHTFQILTKRGDRLAELAPELSWTPNIWMGVSIESQRYVHRIEFLRKVPATVRFLSCEPLLGHLDLDLTGIHWVIVGGESGKGYRTMESEWAISIQRQCEAANTAFFFKQWGGTTPKSKGRSLNGKIYEEMPCTPV